MTKDEIQRWVAGLREGAANLLYLTDRAIEGVRATDPALADELSASTDTAFTTLARWIHIAQCRALADTEDSQPDAPESQPEHNTNSKPPPPAVN